jgi:hypothetical protein
VVSFTFSLICISLPVYADQSQTAHYSLFAHGAHALDSTLIITQNLEQSTYHMHVDVRTYGILANLAPWSGFFETKGHIEKTDFWPDSYQSQSQWKEDTEQKAMLYKNHKLINLKSAENNIDKPKDLPDPKITKNSKDGLSAVLTMLSSAAATQECRGKSKVFDGKRSFFLEFKPQGKVIFEKTRYNIYQGNALECIVEITPDQGKWHDKPRGWLAIQEQGRKHGLLPTIWIAQVKKDAPFIPVQARVKTNYGTLFLHLQDVAQ